MKPVALTSLLLFSALLFTIFFPVDELHAQTTNARVSAELWARATPPGGSSGAIYGQIMNAGAEPLKLHAVRFAPAKHVMMHESVLEDGMMKMKHRDVLIEPGRSVSLAPGGLHIMLMGLSEPLKEGCQYAVALDWGGGVETSHQVSTGGFGQTRFPGKTTKPCL